MCVQTYRALGTTPCMAACPADDGGCLDGHIGEDGRIADAFYDRERCATRAQNFGMGGFQKALTEIVNQDDPETRHAMIHSDFFGTSISSLGYYKESVAQCFECMRVCPVGRTHRKLR
jgi:ferredoxin